MKHSATGTYMYKFYLVVKYFTSSYSNILFINNILMIYLMLLNTIKRYNLRKCHKNSFNKLTVQISLGSLECSNAVK